MLKIIQKNILILLFWCSPPASAYTANKVWFEFHPNKYRVVVNYTVPELKEFRQAYVEFVSKKKAEAFYWALVKGADFYPPDPKSQRYLANPSSPSPW